MMERWLYFMDEFKSIDIELDKLPVTSEDGLKILVGLRNTVRDVIEEKYDVKPIEVKPYRFYKGDNGILFEYTVILKNGKLSAKLLIARNPTELLYEYYNWEYLKI